VIPARIAVLDDEPRMAEVLGMVLRGPAYAVSTFTEPAACLSALESEGFDLLVTDLRMPEQDGISVLRRARAIDPGLPVVLVTAHASVATAVAAMKEGAVDYVEKPIDNDACRAVVARALETTRLRRENRYLRAQLEVEHGLDAVVAESAEMREVLARARRAAKSASTVLVQGETGTGKEVVARAIHLHSDRVAGPFVAVNCKALAGGVLESELFGHERGAFTGADRARAGIFERAHGGTLFLDEIGDLDEAFQAKLLRVLQEGEVVRVGGDRPRAIDVRVVAATHRDLRQEVAHGRFREDLFFRLAVIPLRIPPLRERRADVLPLARTFLAAQNETLGRRLLGWTDEAEAWLLANDWPGNVRELAHTIERGAVLARGDRLEVSDLTYEAAGGSGERTGADGEVGDNLQARLDRAAADHVREVLRRVGGARVEAAKRLGVERTTLYRLMKRYGID
jgi:DNA-binding NtrC family response regulator